jgi:subtilase family serine protease
VGARLKRVIVDPNPVTGGQNVNVTVSLTGPTAMPLSITVDSNDPNVFQVLAPINIGIGGTEESREVSTAEVDQDRNNMVATAHLGSASVQRQFVIKHTPRPDLTVGYLTHRPVVRFQVRNWGEADAPASTAKVDYFNPALFGSTAVPVPALPRQTGVFVQAPNGGAGSWKVYADGPNEIKESNEANNTAVAP